MPTVHSIEAIEALLRRGITPKTDNESALRELGFERTAPAARDGYDATLWERSRDHTGESIAGTGRRLLVRERAVLEPASPVPDVAMPDDAPSDDGDAAY